MSLTTTIITSTQARIIIAVGAKNDSCQVTNKAAKVLADRVCKAQVIGRREHAVGSNTKRKYDAKNQEMLTLTENPIIP